MKLTLRKSEWIEDWYVIESLMRSARISDADVEGSADEMLGIADAIDRRGVMISKRCAVDARNSEVSLWSPRNSITPVRVSIEDADELAIEIRRVLGEQACAKEVAQ